MSTNFLEHARWMARACQQARLGWYSTSPNPRVGCVIVKDGELIAEGFHPKAGRGHAEVNALAQAGQNARGATAYVTLEPCAHHGRTGPCCEALALAGISHVVFGMTDPNPQVAGRGLDYLRAQGIQVTGPVLEADCLNLNTGFIKRMTRALPQVTVKLGMSLDGKTAMASGESKWITSAEARQDVQRLRAEHCAIITSAATATADSAQLTVRDSELQAKMRERQLLRVVIDRSDQLDLSLPIFNTDAPTLWVSPTVKAELPAHVTHIALPAKKSDGEQVEWLLRLLAREYQCNSVLVEAGGKLAGSFVHAKLVDELVLYIAPKLLGADAASLLHLPIQQLAEAPALEIIDARVIGPDIRLRARLAR